MRPQCARCQEWERLGLSRTCPTCDALMIAEQAEMDRQIEQRVNDLPRCDCGHLFEICSHPNCY